MFWSDTDKKGKQFRIAHMVSGYKMLKQVIEMSGLELIEVHPATWQSKLKLRIKGENKTDRKKRYKDTAQRLYPDIKVTMNNCDALLILKYAEAYL